MESGVKATIWDDRISGVHLRTFPTRESFYLFYRTKSGIQRKPKLGDLGQITWAQARKAAGEILAKVAAGRDPGAEAIAKREEHTFGELWAEYWKRHGSKKKSSSEDKRLYDSFLSKLGKKRLSDIEFTMMDDLHEGISAATPGQANRVMSLASKMFSFANRPLEWTDRNPCKGVARNPEHKRKRYMRGEEAARIAEQLRLEAKNSPQAVAFIYLLIFTGARRGEIAKARWSDLDGNKLVLKEHKTDQHGDARVIHLPPQAMAVLSTLPRLLGGTITGIASPTRIWQRIRENAGCPDLRLHDLRHSFASAALASGRTLAQVGELLGHADAQTTKRYAHLVDEAAAEAAASTADVLGRMMKIS